MRRVRQSEDISADKPEKQTSLKIDVDLVLVNATVTDQLNRYVSGLESNHFKIYEDKVEQKIDTFSAEDVPISVGIIFDISGTLRCDSNDGFLLRCKSLFVAQMYGPAVCCKRNR